MPVALATNPRTAAKAAIKRASAKASTGMRQMVVGLEKDLERAYREAVDDIRAYLEAAAGNESLRITVMQDLLRQSQARLSQLEAARNGLLDQGLLDAAALGVQPFAVDAARIGANLTQVADDAVRFAVSFVAEDGLQLSDRLWAVDNGARQDVSAAIQRSIIQGHSASQAAQEFLARGEAVPKTIVDKMNGATPGQIQKNIRSAVLTGEGSAYSNALRVFRTEINRAHGEAYQAAAFEHPDAIGTRFLLSPRHPRVDICDMHAKVNRYGLGPGVYPKGKNPWPAHPNTLSFVEVVFSDEVTDEDRAGKEDRISWLQNQHPGVQEAVLGGRKKRAALEQGLLKENMITTPWNVLKKRLEKLVDVEALKPTPLVTPILPGTKFSQKEAMAYVRHQGQKTGWEFATFHDTESGDLLLKKTSKSHNHVRFTDPEIATLANAANSVQVVHNHPSSSSLSFADLNLSSLDGVHSIVAIGHDGSVYVGKAIKVGSELEKHYRLAEHAVFDRIKPRFESGALTVDQANMIHGHMLNDALGKAGIIKYRTEKITGGLADAMDVMGKEQFRRLRSEIQQIIEEA